MFNFKNVGGRKFFLAIFTITLVSIFVFFGTIDYLQWMKFVTWIFGSYMVGNSIASIGNSLKVLGGRSQAPNKNRKSVE